MRVMDDHQAHDIQMHIKILPVRSIPPWIPAAAGTRFRGLRTTKWPFEKGQITNELIRVPYSSLNHFSLPNLRVSVGSEYVNPYLSIITFCC